MSSLDEPEEVEIVFVPSGRHVSVPTANTALEASRHAGVGITSECGGVGTCGRCVVQVVKGQTSQPTSTEEHALGAIQLDAGFRLACQTTLSVGGIIHVPETSLVGIQRLQLNGLSGEVDVESAVRKIEVEVPPPSITDARSDLSRLGQVLGDHADESGVVAHPRVIRQLSQCARTEGWRLTAYVADGRLIGVSGLTRPATGLAVDLGTTKIAAFLLDLTTGRELASSGVMNPQIAYGEDVISRLVFSRRQPGAGAVLTRLVREAVDGLVGALADKAGVARHEIVDACVVANTAMHHLFVGLPTEQLSIAPFVAAAADGMDVLASELGLELAPGAMVHLPACVGGFVGSDLVGVALATALDEASEITLAIDIGTNSEVVLRRPNEAHMVATSCPSGPAFEGAHIREGMRAGTGAIESVAISTSGVKVITIGGCAPVGMCGSAIVDVLAGLMQTGRMSHRGQLRPGVGGIRLGEAGPEFVLVNAFESGTGSDLIITQDDVRQIQLAKGAIAGGIECLLELTETPPETVGEVLIAGAFGGYLNIDSAKAIGLFPSLANARFSQVGNAAGTGARRALVSLPLRRRAAQIAQQTRYVELTSQPGFQSRFARAMNFPLADPTRS